MKLSNHLELMSHALEQARLAKKKDEVPIGAVVSSISGKIISKAYNLTISLSDPTAHAEIIAIRKAAKIIGNYRLTDTILYITIEPCVMCMGAAIHARIKQIVFGASDPKWGAAGSMYAFHNDTRFNHNPEILKGIMENQCRNIIEYFFKKKR
mmetsp:Transcript_1040/g.820  ORF Transcript_1040/g.820 Transcript_1040/m.820 type:complete len:153 (+) Transcript_1040:217-675(+)|eukprot:CAMPEP_0201281074 /NCGR_PEP_ID=MMETSP1317-20130820/1271_1 /ASSEMBLY_ACC=CAM_ASM_000770 /TAXON_ID=187299 /ORGANISM="Undescribed Undescribed, Strain Undescribed" /LENGTH=152 /DNA_ID=CAMNT_0047589987 /DNA_START=801 /DNA_END=1259 /DNA_ORIENTATION=+